MISTTVNEALTLVLPDETLRQRFLGLPRLKEAGLQQFIKDADLRIDTACCFNDLAICHRIVYDLVDRWRCRANKPMNDPEVAEVTQALTGCIEEVDMDETKKSDDDDELAAEMLRLMAAEEGASKSGPPPIMSQEQIDAALSMSAPSDSELQQLRQRNGELEKENQRLQRDREAAQSYADAVQKLYEEEKDRRVADEEALAKLAGLESEKQELETQLEKSNEQFMALESQLARATDKLREEFERSVLRGEQLGQTKTALRASHAKAERWRTMTFISSGAAALLLLIALLVSSCGPSQNDLDAAKAEVADLRAQVSADSANLAKLTTNMARVSASFDSLLIEFNARVPEPKATYTPPAEERIIEKEEPAAEGSDRPKPKRRRPNPW